MEEWSDRVNTKVNNIDMGLELKKGRDLWDTEYRNKWDMLDLWNEECRDGICNDMKDFKEIKLGYEFQIGIYDEYVGEFE